MQYKSCNVIAEEWHISPRTVRNFCSQDKIPGAVYSGKQWLIPVDAKPPIDRRTKEAKSIQVNYRYNFPVFIYSPYYSNPKELNENEQLLLEAQKLHLEGKYSDSYIICRKILENILPTYLTAGIYITIGFNSILMGMHSEVKNAIDKLNDLIEIETIHKEDINLMVASLQYHIDWNYSLLLAVDPLKLSDEAVPFFKYNMLLINLFCGLPDNNTIYRNFKSDCVYFEHFGIAPAIFAFRMALGIEYITDNSIQEKEDHIRYALNIAIKNNWFSHIVKFFNFNSTLIERCMKEFGNNYLTILNEKNQFIIRNWLFIHDLETRTNNLSLFQYKQAELLLLVSYGLSYEKIACIKGYSVSRAKKEIQELYKITNVKTKSELVRYGKALYDSTLHASK